MKRKVSVWVVIHPKRTTVFNASAMRKYSIAAFVRNYGPKWTWKQLRGYGWRCVKATVAYELP